MIAKRALKKDWMVVKILSEEGGGAVFVTPQNSERTGFPFFVQIKGWWWWQWWQ